MTARERLGIADRLAWSAVLLSVAASVAGLLGPGMYRDSEVLVRLTRADDVFRVAVVLPLLALGLVGAGRGSIAGRLATLGALGTLAYLYAFLSFGAALGPMTLVQIAILGLVSWALALSSGSVDAGAVAEAYGRVLPRRSTGLFFLAVAGLSVLQWAGTILVAVAGDTVPADIANLGLATSPLYAIELAVVVPLLGVAGLGVLRQNPGRSWFAIPLLVFLTLLGLGLAWEAAFVALSGEPLDAGMAIAGVLFLLVPALLLGATVRSARRATAPGTEA